MKHTPGENDAMRRVSYHQSVFDLLGIQPGESAEARRMIEECERQRGARLPEAVRQWYLVDRVVPLRQAADRRTRAQNHQRDHLWYDYSNSDWPESLEDVLGQFAGGQPESSEADGRPAGVVRVLGENQGVCHWFVKPDGSADPPMIVDEDFDDEAKEVINWKRAEEHFSAFVFEWFAGYYFAPWTPLSERSSDPEQRTRPPREKPYLNGLWLYAPSAAAVAPPYIDYLIDNLTEGPRREVAPGVTQYTFDDGPGSIRITTDRFGEEGGASAWWIHADSEDSLYRLASKAWWCGDLPTSLKHWTKTARPVMERLRQGA